MEDRPVPLSEETVLALRTGNVDRKREPKTCRHDRSWTQTQASASGRQPIWPVLYPVSHQRAPEPRPLSSMLPKHSHV